MSFVYKIYRWDAVMRSKNSRPYPMIYIKPDLHFIEFIKNNNYRILVKISDTNTIYDGKTFWGTVDISSGTPNCRPNFFNQTGFYVITLDSFWYGYTEVGKEGSVTIENIIKNTPEPTPELIQEPVPEPTPEPIPEPIPIPYPDPIPSIKKDNQNTDFGLNYRQIIMLFLILLSISLLLYYSFKK